MPTRPRLARWIPILIGTALALALVGWAVFELIPDRFASTEGLTPDGRERARNDVRTSALQLLAGMVVVAGAVLSALTLRTNREGQITERFTRAIDQLGSGNLPVRLGGIYALERIARDSQRDHGPIMEVLTAFVRENAPADLEQAADDARIRPPADVAAILTVIGRRIRAHETGGAPLNLARTDLRGARLDGADLRDVILSYADLRHADLVRARLEGAMLVRARLERASFGVDRTMPEYGARLDEAFLMRAHLAGAHLEGAHLRRAELSNAGLMGANLAGADLDGASLGGADLSGATVGGASFRGAHFASTTVWPEGFDPEAAGALSLDLPDA